MKFTSTVLRFVLTVLMLLFSGLTSAAFFFDRDIEYIDVNLDEVGNNFNRSITVQFKTVCELSGCNPVGRGQDYRFGVSSHDEGEGRGKPSLNRDGLSTFLRRVRFQSEAGRKYTIYNNGWNNWSSLFEAPETVAIERTITFELRLKKSGLTGLQPGQYKSVYLIGLDDEQTQYHDTLEIRIRKKANRTAKISNLKDVSLTHGSAGNYDARTMSFCVYVSDGGQYLLRANAGHTDHNNEFNLSQGSRRLPYQIDFRSNREPWQTGIKPGAGVTGTGSNKENCGGKDNAEVRITLKKQPSDGGRYQDTVTITVTPS